MTTSRKGQGVIDITGQRYGRLVVMRLDKSSEQSSHARWLCRCDCGKDHVVEGYTLRSGGSRSCGCWRRDQSRSMMMRHGHATKGGNSRIYGVWRAMVARCHRLSHKDYPHYGGRGIFVCDRWRTSFENFLADMGEPEIGMTLERRDVNSGYSQDNCCWASRSVQSRNTRRAIRVGGKLLIELCAEASIRYKTVLARIKNGVPPELAIRMTPQQYLVLDRRSDVLTKESNFGK